MRTAIALLTVMVAFLVGSGVALAAVITCPTGPGGECRGTKLADQITGTIGVDQIYASGGDDSVQGGDGADFIKGNLGADFLKGGSDDDEMYSGGGNDTAGQATTGSSVEQETNDFPAVKAKTRSTVKRETI